MSFRYLVGEAHEFRGRQLREHGGISRRLEIALAALQFEHVARNVGEFLRAFDRGVRGQDLLDQRRTRTRQPDHEDRRRARDTKARALLEEFCRVQTAFCFAVLSSITSGR